MTTNHELPDASLIIEIGNASCSHSKSKELPGVDVVVCNRRALASKHWSGISLLSNELEQNRYKGFGRKVMQFELPHFVNGPRFVEPIIGYVRFQNFFNEFQHRPLHIGNYKL